MYLLHLNSKENIAMTGGLCYNSKCLDVNWTMDAVFFAAFIIQYSAQKRRLLPSGFASTDSRLGNRIEVKAGVFSFLGVDMLRQCSRCKQEKEMDQFGKGSCSDGLCGWCKLCMAEYNRARRNDPQYRARHRTLDNEYRKNLRANNPDFASKERQKTRERTRQLRQNSAEYNQKQNAYRRARNSSDPGYRAQEANRKHKRRSLTKDGFTRQEWLDLCASFGNRCACCGQEKSLTVDHVVPISLGGSNDISNIQPLCLSCNSTKSVKIVDYRNRRH